MLERMRRADREGVITITVVMGSYRPLPEPTEVMSRAAKATKEHRFRTPARLSVYDTILERLAQHFQDVVPALWEFFQALRGGVRATPCLGSTPVRYSLGQPAHLRTARCPRDAERLDSIWRLSTSLSGRTRVLAGPGHDHQQPRVRRLPACMLCP
jgi:hypothetical protein